MHLRFLVPIAILAALPDAGHCALPQWAVSETHGAVEIRVAGGLSANASGTSLTEGATIATGRDGYAVIRRGDDSVTLSANSRLRMTDPVGTEAPAEIVSDLGNAIFRFAGADAATNPILIGTPYLRVKAREAVFTVTTTRGGATVQVRGGAARVSTIDGGATHLLTTGMVGLVSADAQYRLILDGTARGVFDSPAAPQAMIAPVPATLTAVADGDAVFIAAIPIAVRTASLTH